MSNDKPLISVIVPIYNGEKWLLPTLRSISTQTFTDFEILLIDDGSVDNSAQICKSFLTQESRARYFYKENGGISSARNLGLKEAKGTFICFLNSDDIVAPDVLSFLFSLPQIHKADIASSSRLSRLHLRKLSRHRK
ncbi:putative glycosyltransferase EpsJ [bioreactor metagenome]|uniref:Putative glycosyltransferase EpsJ n=1 Tax=bioreactor metagenome TaxID=1076179 RepID=A0A644TKH3_9ZZZZ|nr:glycosyltransferase family A protein [Acidaminococcaceae bacterium]